MAFANRRGTSREGQHNSNNFSHLGRLPMREETERRTRMTECEVSAWGWAKREKPTGCWDKRVSCHGMEEFDDWEIDTQCHLARIQRRHIWLSSQSSKKLPEAAEGLPLLLGTHGLEKSRRVGPREYRWRPGWGHCHPKMSLSHPSVGGLEEKQENLRGAKAHGVSTGGSLSAGPRTAASRALAAKSAS